MLTERSKLRDLVLVACHAPFKATTERVPNDPTRDDAWVLQSFQKGEPALYIEHLRCAAALAQQNPEALLICSGGFTRKEAGLRWSEAATYLALGAHFNWWLPDAASTERVMFGRRTAGEDYSRDSFENLLFSICAFQKIVGAYPRHVTVVSWRFKEERFDLHRTAIGFPKARYRFLGSGEPVGLQAAVENERATLRAFQENHYGSSGKLAEKRAARNPFKREHPFRRCPGLALFFDFIENPVNAREVYSSGLPWET